MAWKYYKLIRQLDSPERCGQSLHIKVGTILRVCDDSIYSIDGVRWYGTISSIELRDHFKIMGNQDIINTIYAD